MFVNCVICRKEVQKTGNNKYCFDCRVEVRKIKHNEAATKYRKKNVTEKFKFCILCKIKYKPNSNFQKCCVDCRKINTSNWYKNRLRKHPELTMFRNAKKRAKQKNIPFTIVLEDIKVPKYCPMLGILLKIESSRKGSGPSIDRIIPKLGYTKENIVVISDRANRIKCDATLNELKKIVFFLEKLNRK